MKKIRFKKYIAPWALPNEEIPSHIIWDKDFDFDFIKIQFPKDIQLKEIINVEKFELEDNVALINKEEIKKAKFPNYFGIIMFFSTPYIEKLKVFRDIKIIFYKAGDPKFDFILTARIFRPKIINKSIIDPIILDNSIDEINIPLKLQCVGFGYVDLALRATVNKLQFSIKKNLIERVKENLERKYQIVEDFDDFQELNAFENEKIHVKRTSIDNFFKVLDDYIKILKEKKSFEHKDKFEKKITDYLAENRVEKRFIVDLFIELLAQIKIRNKFENVIMRDPHLEIPGEYFNEIIDEIVIYITYKDLLDNEYNDVEILLPITDLRTEPQKTTIFFKVDIDNIENDTYTDIVKIKRD